MGFQRPATCAIAGPSRIAQTRRRRSPRRSMLRTLGCHEGCRGVLARLVMTRETISADLLFVRLVTPTSVERADVGRRCGMLRGGRRVCGVCPPADFDAGLVDDGIRSARGAEKEVVDVEDPRAFAVEEEDDRFARVGER